MQGSWLSKFESSFFKQESDSGFVERTVKSPILDSAKHIQDIRSLQELAYTLRSADSVFAMVVSDHHLDPKSWPECFQFVVVVDENASTPPAFYHEKSYEVLHMFKVLISGTNVW